MHREGQNDLPRPRINPQGGWSVGESGPAVALALGVQTVAYAFREAKQRMILLNKSPY
jgi:hypothetical protein